MAFRHPSTYPISLVDIASSEDPAEQQQALAVARGNVIQAALLCAAGHYDSSEPRASTEASDEYYDDRLVECVLEYAAVITLLGEGASPG